MSSKSVVFGLASGIAVVVLTLVAVAVVNLPQAEGAVTGDTAPCHRETVVQDQGYGNARQVVRTVCDARVPD